MCVGFIKKDFLMYFMNMEVIKKKYIDLLLRKGRLKVVKEIACISLRRHKFENFVKVKKGEK